MFSVFRVTYFKRNLHLGCYKSPNEYKWRTQAQPAEYSIDDDFSPVTAADTVVVVRLVVSDGATSANMAVTVGKSSH